MTQPRVGVVGHIEWADFVVVGEYPSAGSIVHATEHFEVAAGGGAVAAVAMHEMTGLSFFLTAIGEDERSLRSLQDLRARGVEVHACVRSGREQRRVVTLLDANAERTILIMGDRLVPHGDDNIPWDMCPELDGVYFCGGDAAAAAEARQAKVLIASPRAAEALGPITCDAVVMSGNDPDEVAWAQTLDAPVRVYTDGANGGRWETSDGGKGNWAPVEGLGPAVDSYGCGDCFAAGLTVALASGAPLVDAISQAAVAGATAATRRGPYGT